MGRSEISRMKPLGLLQNDLFFREMEGFKFSLETPRFWFDVVMKSAKWHFEGKNWEWIKQ